MQFSFFVMEICSNAFLCMYYIFISNPNSLTTRVRKLPSNQDIFVAEIKPATTAATQPTVTAAIITPVEHNSDNATVVDVADATASKANPAYVWNTFNID